MTVTATNESNGDSSGFSNAVSAQPVSICVCRRQLSPPNRPTGSATIDVQRSGNLAVAVSINYATSNGSAIAGQDYTSASGTLTFRPIRPTRRSRFRSCPTLTGRRPSPPSI